MGTSASSSKSKGSKKSPKKQYPQIGLVSEHKVVQKMETTFKKMRRLTARIEPIGVEELCKAWAKENPPMNGMFTLNLLTRHQPVHNTKKTWKESSGRASGKD